MSRQAKTPVVPSRAQPGGEPWHRAAKHATLTGCLTALDLDILENLVTRGRCLVRPKAILLPAYAVAVHLGDIRRPANLNNVDVRGRPRQTEILRDHKTTQAVDLCRPRELRINVVSENN